MRGQDEERPGSPSPCDVALAPVRGRGGKGSHRSLTTEYAPPSDGQSLPLLDDCCRLIGGVLHGLLR